MSVTETEMAERPGCPVAHGEPFNSRSLAASMDPEPWLRIARSERPVFWDEDQNVWFATRHEDILHILKNPNTFSSRHTNKFKPMDSPVLREVYPNGHPGLHSMLMKDPPEHSRVRRLANKAFTPKVVAERESEVRRRVDELIDTFIDDGQCDLAAQFSNLLPVQVISDMIGAPPDKYRDFITWGQDYFALVEGAPPLSEEEEQALAERARRMTAWMNEFVDERRQAPGDDLTSRLLTATDDEGEPRLSGDEVIAVISSLFSAGVETTAILIPRLVAKLLADRPDLWKVIGSEYSRIPDIVEEGLRHLNVVRGTRRTATEDTVLAGQTIREGEDVYILYNSANYDERVFDNPAEFDPDRDHLASHLAFGKGIHFCIGAPLARQETAVALERLATRIPNMRLTGEEAQWRPHTTLPRPMATFVEWD